MHSLPYLPKVLPHFYGITLFGVALLLGLVGGEVAKRLRYVPQISGYILTGFLLGPHVFNIVNQETLANAHIFIDISLSLILFELGRHLDFVWLRHDPSILFISLIESALTFGLIFGMLFFIVHMHLLPSAMVGVISLATSPAVVMMVASDLSAEGPVTRRALILTSLNNLYALVIFVVLVSATRTNVEFSTIIFAGYRLIGSVMLGVAVFIITVLIARWIGKIKDNQFVLYVGAVLIAMGFAHIFNLSTMLTLFTLGVAARNLDRRHALMEINFNWLARLFVVVLFVVVGVYLRLEGLMQSMWIVLGLVMLRLIAKIAGVWMVAKSSRLTTRQNFSIALTLLPMAGVAIGMSNKLLEFNPEIGSKLFFVMTAVIAIFNIIGPVTTQIAFIITGESLAGESEGT